MQVQRQSLYICYQQLALGKPSKVQCVAYPNARKILLIDLLLFVFQLFAIGDECQSKETGTKQQE
jgi:hypothetical protein